MNYQWLPIHKNGNVNHSLVFEGSNIIAHNLWMLTDFFLIFPCSAELLTQPTLSHHEEDNSKYLMCCCSTFFLIFSVQKLKNYQEEKTEFYVLTTSIIIFYRKEVWNPSTTFEANEAQKKLHKWISWELGLEVTIPTAPYNYCFTDYIFCLKELQSYLLVYVVVRSVQLYWGR